jgi:hypothetical protein
MISPFAGWLFSGSTITSQAITQCMLQSENISMDVILPAISLTQGFLTDRAA